MPRTGTTVIQNYLSWFYKIPNLQEPFNNRELGFDPMTSTCHVNPYEWVAGLKKGVFKLLSQNLYYIDIKRLLETSGIDHVILIDRNNHTDCCVSAYYGKITGTYHYTQPIKGEKFECSMEFARRWIKHYYRFQAAKQCIESMDVPYDIINYEDFVLDKIQYIAGQSVQSSKIVKSARISTICTNLPYDQMCVNYQQIAELMANKPPMNMTYKFSHLDS